MKINKLNNKRYQQGGWILKWVIIIIGIILILSYFGFSLEDLFKSDATQGNFGFIGRFFNSLWLDYLKPFWDMIVGIMKPFFQAILEFLQRMGRGGTIDI